MESNITMNDIIMGVLNGEDEILNAMLKEEEDMDPIVKYPMINKMTGTTKDLIRREK